MTDRYNWQNIIAQQKATAISAENTFTIRKQRLDQLRNMLLSREAEFLSALAEDLGKSPVEAYASEIAVVLNEIDFLKRHLRTVLRDKKVISKPGRKIKVAKKPYGSVLILSPWNYPLQLALMPLAGALAAGNSCFLKPSELAPATSRLLTAALTDIFSPKLVYVVQGDGQTAAELLKQKFDFIFFTGSETNGIKVAQAAANNLIPNVLELGGKCPCIIDASSVTKATARRIVWGKFLNAGQTCVAPDHILIIESEVDRFVKMLIEQINLLYGESIIESPDYGRIINQKHLQRLLSYLNQGKIRFGGNYQEDMLFLEPTILTDVAEGGSIMNDEIFGPILPVLTYSSPDQLIEQLRLQPEPLAVYAFCKSKFLIQQLKTQIKSGAFCLNQVVQHVASTKFSFGGVGKSGYGRYHGKASLLTFSYEKTLYMSRLRPDFKVKYPPYGKIHLNLIRKFRRLLP